MKPSVPLKRVRSSRPAVGVGLYSVLRTDDKSALIEDVDEASAWKVFLECAHMGQPVMLMRGPSVLAQVRWTLE